MSQLQIKNRIQIYSDELGIPFVEQIGFDHFTQPYPIEEHAHENFEFTYVHSGQVNWELDKGKILRTKGHEFSLVQPNTKHSGEFNIASPATLFWICFDLPSQTNLKSYPFNREEVNLMRNVLVKAGNSSHFAGNKIPKRITELFSTLHQSFVIERKNLAFKLLQFQLYLLITEIIRELNTLKAAQTSIISERAKIFIEQNLSENIHISDVADFVDLSVNHFIEVFKKDSGTTPADYIQRFRCDEAKIALRNTNQTITELTFHLGFNSTQYFATCFKKYNGLTPNQYRVKSRQATDKTPC